MGLISWDDYDDAPQNVVTDENAKYSARVKEIAEDLSAHANAPAPEPVEPISAPEPAPATEPSSEPASIEPEAAPDASVDQAVADTAELDPSAELDFGAERVQLDDKQIINCRADLNQVVPIKYAWAWQAYLDSAEHHWSPRATNFRTDRDALAVADEATYNLLLKAAGLLLISGSEVFASRSLGAYRLITNPESRQYLLKLLEEEKIHFHGGHTLCESLGLDSEEAIKQLLSVDGVQRLFAWTGERARVLQDRHFSSAGPDGIHALTIALYCQYALTKGVWFDTLLAKVERWAGDAFGGLAEIIGHVRRDNAMQSNFMLRVLNQIGIENTDDWTDQLINDLRQSTAEAVLLTARTLTELPELVGENDPFATEINAKAKSILGHLVAL